MNTNWDLLIENHFNNKKENTLKVLSEVVREVMAETPDYERLLMKGLERRRASAMMVSQRYLLRSLAGIS